MADEQDFCLRSAPPCRGEFLKPGLEEPAMFKLPAYDPLNCVAGIWHPGYYGLGVCHLATDRFSGDWVRQTPPRAVKLMRIASVAQAAQYAANVLPDLWRGPGRRTYQSHCNRRAAQRPEGCQR